MSCKHIPYEGPCGDSFCYASCDLESCRREIVCDKCKKEELIAEKKRIEKEIKRLSK